MSLKPPAHLSGRSQKLWAEIVPVRARSPERLILLQLALETLDRADAASAQLAKEGLTTKTKTTGAVHLHPLVRVEKESRALFLRMWKELALQWRFELDGRRLDRE